MPEPGSRAVTVHRARASIDIAPLPGRRVAVLGYGHLGRTAALNVRDSGPHGADRQPGGRPRPPRASRQFRGGSAEGGGRVPQTLPGGIECRGTRRFPARTLLVGSR